MSALARELGVGQIIATLERIEKRLETIETDRRPEWYTLQQAADAWGCDLRTVQRQIADGLIDHTTVRGKRMIHRDNI